MYSICVIAYDCAACTIYEPEKCKYFRNKAKPLSFVQSFLVIVPHLFPIILIPIILTKCAWFNQTIEPNPL